MKYFVVIALMTSVVPALAQSSGAAVPSLDDLQRQIDQAKASKAASESAAARKAAVTRMQERKTRASQDAARRSAEQGTRAEPAPAAIAPSVDQAAQQDRTNQAQSTALNAISGKWKWVGTDKLGFALNKWFLTVDAASRTLCLNEVEHVQTTFWFKWESHYNACSTSLTINTSGTIRANFPEQESESAFAIIFTNTGAGIEFGDGKSWHYVMTRSDE